MGASSSHCDCCSFFLPVANKVLAILPQETFKTWLPGWSYLMPHGVLVQWRVQDLKEGGAKPIARTARAPNFKPRPVLTRS